MIEDNDDSSTDNDKDYNDKNRVAQEIVKKEAIIVYNVTVKDDYIAGYWLFANKFNDKIYDRCIYSNLWIDNIGKSLEALMINHIIKARVNIAKLLKKGLIVFYNDNMKIV